MGDETFNDFKLIYCKRDSGSIGLCHMHDCITWVDPNWCALGKIAALERDKAASEAENKQLREAVFFAVAFLGFEGDGNRQETWDALAKLSAVSNKYPVARSARRGEGG